jgi:hypothetical protein
MYRVTYLLQEYVIAKEFKEFDEAALFGIKQPDGSILEIKYYDDVDHRKPDRN